MHTSTSRSWLGTAGAGLAILSFINLFNYLDRYVVSGLVEQLKHSDLGMNDADLGSLMSAFLFVYTFTAPVFGALGDRRSRPRLIAFGVAFWSFATTLSGFANGYAALLATRASVGIGEAAYGTIAPSLIADYYPADQRSRVMAVFFAAIPIGTALGYVVGGLIGAHFSWRVAFFVAGIPGLILAILCLWLRDPPRGVQDGGEAGDVRPRSAWSTYVALTHNLPYLLTILGYAAYTFAMGGLAYWMPAFLERVRGVPHDQLTLSFGAIVIITGFIGTFLGGWLGDYCVKFSRQALLWLSAFATLLAAPFVWWALTQTTAYYPTMAVAMLLMFLSTGPVNAAIVNLVRSDERASAVAMEAFTIHILGDCISPYLIGRISVASSLETAVKIVPIAVVVAGILWSWAARAQRASQTRPAAVPSPA